MALSDYEVIVIGGGHAGSEAAYASACPGSRPALVTMRSSAIGILLVYTSDAADEEAS